MTCEEREKIELVIAMLEDAETRRDIDNATNELEKMM